MCPACLVTILMAGVGTAGGASALLWSTRRRKLAKPSSADAEPPSATFKEWVASVVSLEEALRATDNAPGAITGSEPRIGRMTGRA